MASDHNPYKLTPAVVSRPSSASASSVSAATPEYRAIDSSEWGSLTKGTKITYEKKSDGKTASGYVNSVDQQNQVLRMYNKDYRTNKYINWDIPFNNIKRISIVAQPYMKQAQSGPAPVISPYQQFQAEMAQHQSLPASQSPMQPAQPIMMPQQQQMYQPSPSQSMQSIDLSIIERKMNELDSKYAAKISGLEQEIKGLKANLNEIVVFLTGLQVTLRAKGITK